MQKALSHLPESMIPTRNCERPFTFRLGVVSLVFVILKEAMSASLHVATSASLTKTIPNNADKYDLLFVAEQALRFRRKSVLISHPKAVTEFSLEQR